MPEYKTILAATDFSEHSLPGLRHAADLAERLGSKVVLTYVVDDRLSAVIFAAASESSAELLERHRLHAVDHLAEFVRKHLPNRQVEQVVLVGKPHDRIVELARERKADLIVVSTHGHGFVGHILVGSTTERILHHAPCPVMVVRSRDA